jgi:predicted metal-dependent enzyme (double-stranded beta helix superfamily)
MCDLARPHAHHAYGFLVDRPEIRRVIEQVYEVSARTPDAIGRVRALEPAFVRLLAADGWLPDECARPDASSGMGGGIGQYALYRAADGSLSLFSLVVPAGAATPVHDHLAWGLVGVYRGRQDETVYRRLDDGSDPGRATLEIAKRQTLERGQCYTLLPPADDIHYVRTVSDGPSVSIHLLANDTACVWRHQFDPTAGTVTPFRSGYTNAPCPPEEATSEPGAGA